jgi:hypothetical protein
MGKKISIRSLFPDENCKGSICKSGKLDINTLYSSVPNSIGCPTEEYIGKDLIKSIEKGRKKRLQVMLMCYNNCCRKIKEAENNGEYFIFFEVPQSVNDCPKYNPIIITEYISQNLRNKCLDTVIIDKGKTIYVNWEKLEMNIENFKNT